MFANGHIKTKCFDSSENSMSIEEHTKLSSIEDGAEVNNVETYDTSLYDFVISDEDSNDIVRFRNGHIQTKNFDSNNINTKESILKGKKVAFLGDSITAGSNASPSSKRYSTVFGFN